MNSPNKTFVHVGIDAVDAVVRDLDGSYDPELFDHYETFDAARDAALTSVETMIDEADYDGEDHLEELERMRAMLEAAQSYEDLMSQAAYQWFLGKASHPEPIAA